jgi:hypothetical protein
MYVQVFNLLDDLSAVVYGGKNKGRGGKEDLARNGREEGRRGE